MYLGGIDVIMQKYINQAKHLIIVTFLVFYYDLMFVN